MLMKTWTLYGDEDLPPLTTMVEKETVLANKDVVLSGERYFETQAAQTQFEMVKLGDYFWTI